jgi:hypothetical protein
MEFALAFMFMIFAIVKIAEWVSGSSGGDHQTSNSPGLSQQEYRRIVGYSADDKDIRECGINEIKNCGKFSPKERAAEYRRRGKSPSGVIDGEYNDQYRGNDEYNDTYRDWDADA